MMSKLITLLTAYCFFFIISCQNDSPTDTTGNSTEIDSANAKFLWIAVADGVILRENPELHSKKINTIPYNSRVIYLEEKNTPLKLGDSTGKWTKIYWNDTTGWVFSAFLTNQQVASSTLNNKNTKVLIDSFLMINDSIISINSSSYGINKQLKDEYDVVEKSVLDNYNKGMLMAKIQQGNCEFTNEPVVLKIYKHGFATLKGGVYNISYLYNHFDTIADRIVPDMLQTDIIKLLGKPKKATDKFMGYVRPYDIELAKLYGESVEPSPTLRFYFSNNKLFAVVIDNSTPD